MRLPIILTGNLTYMLYTVEAEFGNSEFCERDKRDIIFYLESPVLGKYWALHLRAAPIHVQWIPLNVIISVQGKVMTLTGIF
jgi:hypothetical protein